MPDITDTFQFIYREEGDAGGNSTKTMEENGEKVALVKSQTTIASGRSQATTVRNKSRATFY